MRKSYAAGWTSVSPTPAQLKEFFAQIESGRITKPKLQTFLRSEMVPKNEEVARMILGDDIVFPNEIAEARGFSYTDANLKHFADTMPSEEMLRWCKANDYAVMAGPPSSMGLLEVRSLWSERFYSKPFCSKTGGWYKEHSFSRDDKVKPEWLAIRKGPVPNSVDKNWNEQLRLLTKDEHVPNAGEMGWFILIFYEVRNVRLFERIYVRTSSVTSGGRRVSVGHFDGYGLRVPYCWVGHSYFNSFGVAASRKLPAQITS